MFDHPAQKKVAFLSRFAATVELLRSIIDHKKVFVLALNGPGVGGGAAWFQGVADIVLAAQGAWLQVPFNALGLVPENGSAISFAQHMGVHRANDFLMFGRKCTVEELEQWGMVNRIFPAEGFQEQVVKFLQEQLDVNDGKSMMETKRLQNAPRRSERMMAVFDAAEALAERFVEGAPAKRFADKKALLEGRIGSDTTLFSLMLTCRNSKIQGSFEVVVYRKDVLDGKIRSLSNQYIVVNMSANFNTFHVVTSTGHKKVVSNRSLVRRGGEYRWRSKTL